MQTRVSLDIQCAAIAVRTQS